MIKAAESASIFERLGENLDVFLLREVSAQGDLLDRDTAALKKAFSTINARFFSQLFFSPTLTSEIPPMLQADVLLERVARVSGALAFTAAQCVGACFRLSKSSNQSLTGRLVPEILAGTRTIGVGTTHLRAGFSPIVAKKNSSGFVVEGQIQWATGWGIFTDILIAARVGLSGLIVGFVPFSNHETPEGRMVVGPPHQLTAMNSTQTVPLSFNNYFLHSENIVLEIPDAEHPDQPSPPPLYLFPLGCAHAALTQAKETEAARTNLAIMTCLVSLEEEIAQCLGESRKIYALQNLGERFTKTLEARAWMDLLLMRSVNAALPLVGGKSNFPAHPLNRLYREALVYATSLQTKEITERKLCRLAEKFSR